MFYTNIGENLETFPSEGLLGFYIGDIERIEKVFIHYADLSEFISFLQKIEKSRDG